MFDVQIFTANLGPVWQGFGSDSSGGVASLVMLEPFIEKRLVKRPH
jgi:hypothetical protein